jgi:hypothetical protein
MTTFTYLVTVEVEDDLGMPTECYDEDYFDQCDTDEDDETGEVTGRWLSPATKASIIMASRLGVDEDMGTAIGNYRLDYQEALA